MNTSTQGSLTLAEKRKKAFEALKKAKQRFALLTQQQDRQAVVNQRRGIQVIARFLVLREREKNVLFNDALNTFYLRLYGVRHMVKDHSDSEKGNRLPPHRLLLSINSKGYFICTIPQTG